MRQSRRTWASPHRHPTSRAAAPSPLDRHDKRGEITLTQLRNKDDLTPEELDEQDCEELPERQAMSLIDANVAAPVDGAAALNVLSDDSSTAVANAEQSAETQQS
jgi:hypothetical protein